MGIAYSFIIYIAAALLMWFQTGIFVPLIIIAGIIRKGDGAGLALNIAFSDNSLDLDLALETSEYFRLEKKEAKSIIEETKTVVSKWRQEAKRLNIPSLEMKLMENAFSIIQ